MFHLEVWISYMRTVSVKSVAKYSILLQYRCNENEKLEKDADSLCKVYSDCVQYYFIKLKQGMNQSIIYI